MKMKTAMTVKWMAALLLMAGLTANAQGSSGDPKDGPKDGNGAKVDCPKPGCPKDGNSVKADCPKPDCPKDGTGVKANCPKPDCPKDGSGAKADCPKTVPVPNP